MEKPFYIELVLAQVYRWRRREEDLEYRIKELEKSLGSTMELSTSERKGRVKAQQVFFYNLYYSPQ